MASAGGRAEECASTLMRMTVQSQVRSRTGSAALGSIIPLQLHHGGSSSSSSVADAWRALKSPSLGESSLDGAVSGMSTTSPSEGLSVAPGTLGDTPHFNTLAGGALGTRTSKYCK